MKRTALERRLAGFEHEAEASKYASEKKLQLSVDERFKARDEKVKAYFDGQVSRILLGSQDSEKVLELSRELCALKLANHKVEQKLEALSAEVDSNQAIIQNLKEVNTDLELELKREQ